mgnify:CR=1 FL=1
MTDELDALRDAVHALELRLVKLETTIKLGGFLLGVVPTALQLWTIFH